MVYVYVTPRLKTNNHIVTSRNILCKITAQLDFELTYQSCEI